MTARRRFSPAAIEALDKAKVIGVRAGGEHRYRGVWVVVVEKRVFARAFQEQPPGSIQSARKR